MLTTLAIASLVQTWYACGALLLQLSPIIAAYSSHNASCCSSKFTSAVPQTWCAPLQSLALLLLPGRLHKPQTARPAPLLAAAAAEAAAAAAATAPSTQRRQAQDAEGTAGPGTGSAAEGTASQGPAVALVRCTAPHEVAMALSLHGRRVYCEQRERGGAASWQPITVRRRDGKGWRG